MLIDERLEPLLDFRCGHWLWLHHIIRVNAEKITR
jgi:hypothetical protein